jgi:hypothetical protein
VGLDLDDEDLADDVSNEVAIKATTGNQSEIENMTHLRELQIKLLAESTPVSTVGRPRSGRRHTLCLTR